MYTMHVGRDSAVSIEARYGQESPGIEFRWRRDFPNPSRPALEPTQPTAQWLLGLFRGVRRPGRGVDNPPHLAARLKRE